MHFLSLLVKEVASTEPATTRTAINILLACGRLLGCRANLGAVRTLIQLLVESERRESKVHRNILKVLCLYCHDVLCWQKMKIHNGMPVLVGELKSAEYGEPAVYGVGAWSCEGSRRSLEEAGCCHESIRRKWRWRREGDSVDENATCSLVLTSQPTAVAADSADFSCSSSFQGSEPSSSRLTSTQSSGSSSQSATPVEASWDVAVVPVADTYS